MTASMSGDFCFFVEDHRVPAVPGPFDPLTAQNVLRAIKLSWAKVQVALKTKSKPRVRRVDENYLNGSLRIELNALLDTGEVPYFLGSQFQDVVLEGKQQPAHRSRAPKMPDLQVSLVQVGQLGLARSKAVLCIECKLIVNPEHVREYVIHGMHRFVCGDYSPHMSLGVMLGYAEAQYQLPRALDSYLKRAKHVGAVKCKAALRPFGSGDGACHMSRHARSKPAYAKRINLLHVWLPHAASRKRCPGP
jgi:hypothetical protein